MRNGLYILLSLLLVFESQARLADDSLRVKEMRNKIKPILSTSSSAPDSDILFMVPELEGKQVIAVGEATHGSKEFFTLKHRLFRLLAEQSDCRIFGLEESYAAGLLVNDYIHGRGDLKANDVVMKMSFMWRTREMKELIEWMKTYNDGQTSGNKITFYGFDFHGPHHAVKRLFNYFETTDTVFLSVIKPFLKKFEEVTFPKERINEKEFNENKQIIEGIRNTLKNNKDRYLQWASAERWTEADHLMNCLYQYMDTYRSGDVDFFKRDPYMCQNVDWIMNQTPTAKIMLWAHNEHVASGGSLPSMGKLLKQEYGNKFYNIGFVFNEGEYTGTRQYKCSALEAGIFSFKPAPIGSFSDIISRTGIATGFLAMNKQGLDQNTATWFCGPQRVYEVGYRGFDNLKKLLLKKRKLSELYDAVIFVKKVSNTDHYLFGPNKNGAVYFHPFPSN